MAAAAIIQEATLQTPQKNQLTGNADKVLPATAALADLALRKNQLTDNAGKALAALVAMAAEARAVTRRAKKPLQLASN